MNWNKHITTRVASTFLLLSLITVGAVGSVAFFKARTALKKAAYDRLNVSATLKEDEISRWFEDQQRDFFLITRLPDIQRNLTALLNPSSPAAKKEAHRVLSDYLKAVAKIKPNLSEIFVLDQTNRILVSTNSSREGEYVPVASVTYLRDIEPQGTFAPIFYVHLITGRPTVTLATPLNNTKARQGAILAHLNLDQIDQIIRDRSGLGASGETYLVGSLVNEFTFISGNASLGQKVSGISSEGIDAAMQGRSGSGLYRNYAGVPVIGVYRWLNDQDIALLVEMGQAEAFDPARQLAGTIVLVGLVSVGGLAIGVRWLARQLQISRQQLESYSQQLEQKAQEADAANRSKSEFLANMSHELRTPLNAILGFTQLLSRDVSTQPAQREQLQIINHSGEHLLTLINDVLEMSKIEAGRTALSENNFNLFQLLHSIEEMFQLKAESKGLRLVFKSSVFLPEYIRTDEGKLRQVLINLISNAIKFTQTGEIVVRVETPSDSRLRFEVEDSGPGIAAHEMPHLFKPFIQTEAGRASKQGTGLGLPISRKFVQLMGGEMLVSSALGQGSIFAFTIQFQAIEAADVQATQLYRRVVGLAPGQPTYRILLVEDRWENRQLLARLLLPIGFEIREAENGEEAISLWESWEPHLIWMDMRMPVLDGYEATKRIRAHLKGQATVIIALTASAFEESRSIILAAGCNDFVRKPFKEQVLFEKMAQHLGVQYLYEDYETLESEPEAFLPTLPYRSRLHPELLNNMPLNWVEQLHEAATKVNAKQIRSLIEQIPGDQAVLAAALSQRVSNFQFEEIMMLTQQTLQAR